MNIIIILNTDFKIKWQKEIVMVYHNIIKVIILQNLTLQNHEQY